MAILIDGKIVSDKERKKKPKAGRKTTQLDIIGKDVRFLDGVELYEWVVVKDNDEEHYIVEAFNKNIHKHWELQSCIVPKKDIRLFEK